VTKVYEDGTEAVRAVDLTIEDGTLMVLVGPSGCGKTTLLRMVAGLEEITGGSIRLGDAVINDVEAQNRDLAMVFQTYALYPHMTVRGNLEYGLRRRKLDRAVIDRRIRDAVGLLGIEDFLGRYPGQLSGGQAQRVAVARALVRDPAVLLMDEPLSSLDAKLRTHARAEIRRLQAETGTTTVYVTHDQVEAMTMGDRIAVMTHAELVQCGTPEEVYRRPDNVFVADFIGSPAMNLFPASIASSDTAWDIRLGDRTVTFTVPPELPEGLAGAAAAVRTVGIRPEDARIGRGPETGWCPPVPGRVVFVEDFGRERFVHAEIAPGTTVVAEATGWGSERPGDGVELSLRWEGLHLFAEDGRAVAHLAGTGRPAARAASQVR
jgi:ABC-type sugar transport system ATPase subunit